MFKLLVVASAVFIQAHAIAEEHLKEMIEVGNTCAEQEHATSEDMSALMTWNVPPPTQAGKCVLACFYKHYKVITPDGDLDKSAALEAFDQLKDLDADMHKKMTDIVNVCEHIEISDDHCETGSRLATCVKEEMDKVKRHLKIAKLIGLLQVGLTHASFF